ncbi:MAG: hypothetical protein RL681_477 [Candidatus Parcubacteria bacterium]|jgi:cell division protein FtsI/penicillin-binding protein 2
MVSRFAVVAFFISAAYASLFGRLYVLQVMDGSRYLSEAQEAIPGVTLADRGSIFFVDKNGKTLSAAANKDFPTVYATPNTIPDAQEAAHAVAPLLNLPIDDVVRKLSKSDNQYALLNRKVPQDIADQIAKLDLKGIYVRALPERHYSQGRLASQLIGYVGPNDTDEGVVGKYGVERFYNDRLAGKPGNVEDGMATRPVPGENLTLTIDPNIQFEAERILMNAVEKHGAVAGNVIVEEPATGRILAMGNWPNFDPNKYQEADISDFLNPAVQSIYEPGSVMKVVTMAAGIDAGKITPQTTFNDTGVLIVSGRKIQNWDLKAHGVVTMTNVIEKSLNTGAAFAERQMGHDIFLQYLRQFGFDRQTGIDLPGELKGDLDRLTARGAPAVAFATASFGQGVAATPLEMLNAVAAIANGGTLMRPFVNAELGPQELRRVISPETAKQVAEMMVSAVDKAEVAAISGYTIAGKTGTAQVPGRGGYTDDVIHTYIGFGPTAHPRFIILLKLDKPAGAPLAGTTVVPAFRDLAQFILGYMNIPPDRVAK